MDCDIVLLPNETLAEQAVSVSRDLQRPDTVFTLEDGKFYPHLSLYMVRLKQSDIKNAADTLGKIATAYKTFSLQATHYDQERAYVVVDYETLPELHALQRAVLEAVNPMRDGIMEKDWVRALEATGLAKQNYDTYGYKYVGDLFKPHITLTRFENEELIDESVLPNPSVFSGQFTRLALCELGVSNTCVRKLAEFPLLSA